MKSRFEYKKLLNAKMINYIENIRHELGLDNLLDEAGSLLGQLIDPTPGQSGLALRAAGRRVNLEGLLLIALASGIAERIETPVYDARRLFAALPALREMTRANRDFLSELAQTLNAAGVILVALPTLEGSRLNGAMRHLSDRYLLLVTDRLHYADTFWFTLFHEVAHILRADDERLGCGTEEDEADALSGELLFPDEVGYRRFLLEADRFSARGIERYAKSTGIDPALVLGRLQKENIVSYQSHLGARLRRRLYLDGPYPFRGRAIVQNPIDQSLQVLISREG